MTASPGPDAEGHENGEKRIRAGGNADGVRRGAVFAHRLLEGLDLRPEDEALAGENFIDLGAERSGEGAVLLAQVEERHAHGAKHASFELAVQSEVWPRSPSLTCNRAVRYLAHMSLLRGLFWVALFIFFAFCFVVLFEYGTADFTNGFKTEATRRRPT